ncbi:Aste57867_14232 [Aphanomyces stellatus]|uniref:Aste57867_14232 protein n=1 Tax=Aphanomyces stellatus TaxID=120398 RepID=A0A485L0X7_9STRA|nr:hypothetical protein As57867_014181 [Aphanomyces stellatus]VFT91057.1 Aste57867_14232 [Aphanomyces stellatus]
MANELKKLAGGRPMYFYLIDEVTQLPVTGTGYPIELVGETSEYATFASNCMPFIQGGFQLIKKANNVARMFKVLGMPSLDKDLVTKAGETIDSMKCTPAFLESSLKAGTNENDVSEKVVNVYGGALRELKAFFAKHSDERFAGLEREVDRSTGNVVWTTAAYAARLKGGETLFALQAEEKARKTQEERDNGVDEGVVLKAIGKSAVKTILGDGGTTSAPKATNKTEDSTQLSFKTTPEAAVMVEGTVDSSIQDVVAPPTPVDPKQPGECSCGQIACAVM